MARLDSILVLVLLRQVDRQRERSAVHALMNKARGIALIGGCLKWRRWTWRRRRSDRGAATLSRATGREVLQLDGRA